MKRFLILLIVSAAAGAVAPASAFAGIYTEYGCIGGYAWQQADITSYFALDNKCPDQMDLSLGVPAQPGQNYGRFVYTISDGKPIEAVRVKMWGSNGTSNRTRQGFLVCAAVCDFSKIVTVSGPGGVGSAEFDLAVADGTLPVGARRVMIVGDCMGPGICLPGDALHFSDIEIAYRDDSPPQLALTAPQGWQNDVVRFDYSAEDDGSGIAAAKLTLDGFDEPLFECGFASLDDGGSFCPSLVSSRLEFAASDLPNGSYTLRLTARSFGGEGDELTRTVKVDSTVPPPLKDVLVTPGRNGWVNRGVVNIAWSNSNQEVATETESGIVGTYYDIQGPDVFSDPPPRYVAGAINSVGIRLSGYSLVNLAIWTIDAAGNTSERAELSLNLDTYFPNPPLVDPIAPINRADLESGRTIDWTNINVGPSGICGAKLAFSRLANFNPGEDPGDLTVEGDALSYALVKSDLGLLPQGDVSLHLRSYSCAGLAGAVAHVPVLVDFATPEVSTDSGSGWLSELDDFRLRATDPVAGGGKSGIAKLRYSIDGLSAAQSDLEQASLRLGPGEHTVVATAIDRAGNESLPEAFAANVDGSAPSGAFEQRSLLDPRSITASVWDSESGISAARIEYRDQSGVWRRIGATAGGAKSLRVSAQLPEDLPAGEYPLALIAYDVAGHASTITSFADGSTARFASPVRSATKLTAFVASAAAKRRWSTQAVGEWGDGFIVRGRLTSAGGTALASRSVELATTPEEGVEGGSTTVITSADGRWSAKLPGGPNRTLRARFFGDATGAPTSAVARILTNAKVSLLARRQKIRSGEKLNLRGRVSGTSFAQPENGKRIVLEWRAGGGYGAVRKTLHASDDGRFVYGFRYVNRSGRPVRFRLRAVSPAEQFWPFERGQSNSIDVVVTP